MHHSERLDVIAYRAYNVVVPKFRIEDFVVGGLPAFKRAFRDVELQEDEYLIAFSVENATGVRNCFELLLGLGFTYHDGRGRSDDFTVVAKEGIWWPVPWLVNNNEGCWFIADVEAPG